MLKNVNEILFVFLVFNLICFIFTSTEGIENILALVILGEVIGEFLVREGIFGIDFEMMISCCMFVGVILVLIFFICIFVVFEVFLKE